MDIKNILIAGRYEEEFNRQGANQYPYHFLFKKLEDINEEDLNWADVYVGSKPCSGMNISTLKWVHSFNAGVNNFLEISGWLDQDILLTRTICTFGKRISEYCLSYVLKDLQYHQEFQEKQREKKWQPKTPKMVKDQTVVIYGTGEIGLELAKTFTFFGATVFGVSRSGNDKPYFKKVVDLSQSHTIKEKANYIISTLPLTIETNNFFNSAFFCDLHDTVFLNVGRGLTVNESALINALDNGNVRHAVLDVVNVEPLSEHSKLWSRPEVIITPHISAVTEIDEAVSCFFDTLNKIEKEEVLDNKVDLVKGY
ncbi:D-2-hydroxyacid dehydrogenase [Bacillus pinisoli]|uniref:D-2-hydroxyacid dehydrogenase n=1 Tax=Bacillus pinisoli TaxID=2901866 RepID=UPI001FF3F2D4|nr:D-2-hydroxyacid dehydrogenase [Bacillus pinisoli]